MVDRRAFLGAMGAASAALALPTPAAAFTPRAFRQLGTALGAAGGRSAETLATDEDFWLPIQQAFDVDRTVTNLNNGGVCPTPTHVLEAMVRDLRFSNELPVEHMWRVLEPRVESAREACAREFGCDPEELAITRNASEANEILILGLDLTRGDEVIVSTQNYGRMLTTWEQRARREGIVVKRVQFAVPPASPQAIVDRFAEAITPRTRVIEVPHITNLTGQILPIRELGALARARNIALLVDGAHAFAHFPFTRDELQCDFYGTSLHKWLLAPIGTGFLYVRREKIPSVWPLMAAPETMNADIRKFEEIGTHPAANHNAIPLAMAFHRGIGAERKVARLRYLRNRWAKRVVTESGGRICVLTPLDTPDAGAIALVQIDGVKSDALSAWLRAKHAIVTVSIDIPGEFHGVRVTPNVYTTVDEVDRFADRLLAAARRGIA
ncbi:MAG: aminotransferase class V-fold PLP-dependent enzyme [Gemmatimonadaceae bacterium]|jgi:selenocysteine lyase/cysteine desulfurase|nr:aminotransferase class V-fold PLP-dependent enzyme [Gemmatimonadaceae bacterium]